MGRSFWVFYVYNYITCENSNFIAILPIQCSCFLKSIFKLHMIKFIPCGTQFCVFWLMHEVTYLPLQSKLRTVSSAPYICLCHGSVIIFPLFHSKTECCTNGISLYVNRSYVSLRRISVSICLPLQEGIGNSQTFSPEFQLCFTFVSTWYSKFLKLFPHS